MTLQIPNYTFETKSPVQQALEGYQQGLQIQKYQSDLEKQRIAEQQAIDRQNKFNQFLAMPEKTSMDWQNFWALDPKNEALKEAWKNSTEQENRSALSELSQISSAFDNSKDDAGVIISNTAKKYSAIYGEKSPQASLWSAADAMYKINPEMTMGYLNSIKDTNPYAKELEETRAKKVDTSQKKELFSYTKAEAKGKAIEALAKGAKAEIEAGNEQFNQEFKRLKERKELQLAEAKSEDDRAKINLEIAKLGELPESSARAVNLSANNAEAASGAQKMLDDAKNYLLKVGRDSGKAAYYGRELSKLWGDNERSILDNHLKSIKNLNLITSPAAKALSGDRGLSDGDRAVLEGAAPSDIAGQDVWLDYISRQSNLAAAAKVSESGKASWITSNKSLIPSKSKVDIDGVIVPEKTSYIKYTDALKNALVFSSFDKRINSSNEEIESVAKNAATLILNRGISPKEAVNLSIRIRGK